MAHQVRIKELHKELQQEKGRYLVLSKTSQEKVEAKDQECLALQRRMHQAHEQHVLEMSKAKMQMGDGQAASMVQRLQEVRFVGTFVWMHFWTFAFSSVGQSEKSTRFL
jgi:hypothetical protein